MTNFESFWKKGNHAKDTKTHIMEYGSIGQMKRRRINEYIIGSSDYLLLYINKLKRAARFQKSFQRRQEAAALVPVLGGHLHVNGVGGRPVASRGRVAEFHQFFFHGCGDLLLV